MRVSTNFRKWPEHIWAESQWLLQLAAEGSIKAPVPILNLQGEPYSNHYFFYQGSNIDVIIYPWIEGEVARDNPTEEQLFALGQAMARMHQLSKDWEPQGYANFLDVDRPLMVRRDNLFSFQQPLISPEIYQLLFELRSRSEKLFDSLKERFDRQLIHADLHIGNILWDSEGKMSILDFDDAGIGSPLQDIAISIFYLRDDQEREKHLLAGYASIAPLPEYQPEELELLIANRQLVLLNYLFETTTADDVALIPDYLGKTERRLRHFFQTGEFELLM
jgi:Ser/Thr protein kinase RdoA (MazF antagonist)